MNYSLIRKIHLYACLSTTAVLTMFILTSYQMIHHDWFSHDGQKESIIVDIDSDLASEDDWRSFNEQNGIQGRLVRESHRDNGDLVRQYASAGGSFRVTFVANKSEVEIVRTSKSTADAMIGIHRQRGYGGPLQYSLYALLLDIVGVALIVFAITGIIMWFKLLRNNKIAWIIFVGGFIYVLITIILLVRL
ncbi:MAG: PepSY-associated TM helix domain-containing protein [Saprospiraceae bacterium]|nr:PepSY-associated TM helix domain-containing protein [Saprospiraceae bacterium]